MSSLQLTSLTKILKCAKDNDVVTLKAADDADSLGMVFESPSKFRVEWPLLPPVF
jgi:proliferating cell nuclear antigen